MESLNPGNSSMQELDDSGCVQDASVIESYKGMAHILDLSDDVLLCILQYLTPRDLKALGHTCPRLGTLICDRTLWTRVDARMNPVGQLRLKWFLTHCLSPATQELKIAGYANKFSRCLGVQDLHWPVEADQDFIRGTCIGSQEGVDVEHFLLRMWYPHLPRYAVSPRWPDKAEADSKKAKRDADAAAAKANAAAKAAEAFKAGEASKTGESSKAGEASTSGDCTSTVKLGPNLFKMVYDPDHESVTVEHGPSNSGDEPKQSDEASNLAEKPPDPDEKAGVPDEIAGSKSEQMAEGAVKKSDDSASKSGNSEQKPGSSDQKSSVTADKTGNSAEKTGNSAEKTGDSAEKTGDTADNTGETAKNPQNAEEKMDEDSYPYLFEDDFGENCKGPQFTLTTNLMRQLRKTCTNLTSLALEYCNLDYKTTNLRHFPLHLKKLSLRGSRCYNLPLNTSYLGKVQERLPNLEYLDVSECDWFEPASLMPLSKLPSLTELYMRDCKRLTECVAYASLATRYGFRKLRVFDVRGSPLADSEVSALGWLPRLEELYVSPPDEYSGMTEHTHSWEDTQIEFIELDGWEHEEPEYYKIKSPEPEEEEDEKEEEPDNERTGDNPLNNPWWSHERRIIVIQPNANRQLEERYPFMRQPNGEEENRPAQPRAPRPGERGPDGIIPDLRPEPQPGPAAGEGAANPRAPRPGERGPDGVLPDLRPEPQPGPAGGEGAANPRAPRPGERGPDGVLPDLRPEPQPGPAGGEGAANPRPGAANNGRAPRPGERGPDGILPDLRPEPQPGPADGPRVSVSFRGMGPIRCGSIDIDIIPNIGNPRPEQREQVVLEEPMPGPSSPRQGPAVPRPVPTDPRQGPSQESSLKNPRPGPSNQQRGPQPGPSGSGQQPGPSGQAGPSNPQQGPSNPQGAAGNAGEGTKRRINLREAIDLAKRRRIEMENEDQDMDRVPVHFAPQNPEQYLRIRRDDAGEVQIDQGPRPGCVRFRRHDLRPIMHIDVDINRESTIHIGSHVGYHLVSDSALLRFGRAINENVNYVHIGRHGIHTGSDSGSRPDRSNLRILSVTGYRNITDRSLQHLVTAAPHLLHIDFTETSVTPRGVELFKAVRPDCDVIFSEFKS